MTVKRFLPHPCAAAFAAVLACSAPMAQPAAQSPAPAAELPLTTAARTSLGITIYNDGRALVRDARRLRLAPGVQKIAMRDVAATIQPETASLKSVSGPGFDLLEQNFDFDLLTPAKLMEKAVGQQVTLVRVAPGTGAETREKGKIKTPGRLPGGSV